MINKEFFLKHQKILLWFCNTSIIRIWFRGIMQIEEKIILDRILPNSIRWCIKINKRKIYYKEKFFIDNHYAVRLYKVFKPLWYIFHYWDQIIANNINPRFNLGFDTL